MKWLRGGFGLIFLAAGAIGLFLPLWPTTIFWILALLCLSDSFPGLRDWIYRRPGLGPVIRTFMEQGRLSRKSKIAALGGMILAGLISSLLMSASPLGLGLLWGTLILVSLFILTRQTPGKQA